MATKKAKTGKGVKFNNGTDTWSAADESSNGQMSLDQGSSTYEDFVEAREQAAPSAPDDEMHQQLEEYNAVKRTLAERAFDAEHGNNDTKKIKARRQMQKRALDKMAHTAAVRKAFETPDNDDDDERLDDYVVKDEMIYDDSVAPDEFDDRWVDYVESGKY